MRNADSLRVAAVAVVQGLIDSGVEQAILSPGSRNAPLLSALVHSSILCHTVVDERSAAFIALGIAQRSGKPVAVLCTSGTALLNYYPAIAEAYYARIPLIILSADRPERLIDQWDGQCIRQADVFKNHIRFQTNLPVSDLRERELSASVHEACNRAQTGIPGPVHINLPFEEPLYFNPPAESAYSAATYRDQVFQDSAQTELPELLKEQLSRTGKILWINGYGSRFTKTISDRIPVLSDILSASPQSAPLQNWDAMLTFAAHNKPEYPELLISTGTYFVSKALKMFLRGAQDLQHWHISEEGEIGDPFFSSPQHWPIDPDKAVKLLLPDFSGMDPGYMNQWVEATDQFRQKFRSREWERFTEFGVVRTLLRRLEGTFHIGNSMPIRYASWVDERKFATYFGNRGTSGIDGSCSTAVGHATYSGKQEYLIVGDLSFFYDSNAFWNALKHNLQVFVLNNSGGRIFEFLKGHELLGEAKVFQTTEHNRTAEYIARDHGWNYHAIKSYYELEGALARVNNQSGPCVWEIFTDHKENLAFYHQLMDT